MPTERGRPIGWEMDCAGELSYVQLTRENIWI